MPAVDAPAVDVAQVLAYELVDAAVVQLRGRLGRLASRLVDVDRLRLDAFQLVVSLIAHEGAPSVDRAASTAANSL